MDYLVIDDYFEKPKDVRELALNATYYTKETHPGNIGNFPGHRTNYINEWNKSLYQSSDLCQKNNYYIHGSDFLN